MSQSEQSTSAVLLDQPVGKTHVEAEEQVKPETRTDKGKMKATVEDALDSDSNSDMVDKDKGKTTGEPEEKKDSESDNANTASCSCCGPTSQTRHRIPYLSSHL